VGNRGLPRPPPFVWTLQKPASSSFTAGFSVTGPVNLDMVNRVPSFLPGSRFSFNSFFSLRLGGVRPPPALPSALSLYLAFPPASSAYAPC